MPKKYCPQKSNMNVSLIKIYVSSSISAKTFCLTKSNNRKAKMISLFFFIIRKSGIQHWNIYNRSYLLSFLLPWHLSILVCFLSILSYIGPFLFHKRHNTENKKAQLSCNSEKYRHSMRPDFHNNIFSIKPFCNIRLIRDMF